MILPPCRIKSGGSINRPSEQILDSLRNSVAPSKGNLRLIALPLFHQLPPRRKLIVNRHSTVGSGTQRHTSTNTANRRSGLLLGVELSRPVTSGRDGGSSALDPTVWTGRALQAES